MLNLRPGSHVYSLLLVLAAVGEFPTRSLRLLGNERSYEALVHRLETVQQFRSADGNGLGSYKLLTVSGRGERRTIHLSKSALPLLSTLHPSALECYMEATGGHRFSGSRAHIQRNHRVAESLAVCLSAGVETRPWILPPLQKRRIERRVPDTPSFYLAKALKWLDGTELNKTIFTRLTGALFSPGCCYAVYNTQGHVMKWSGMGEFKTACHLTELARMNAGLEQVDRALLLGERMDVALQTLLESDKSPRMELRFDRIYPHIHFIPADRQGVRLLRLLTLPDWNERLLSAVFPHEWRLTGPGSFECDARHEGRFILSHLDGDIARLIRFRQALENGAGPFEVLCFPWQAAFLREYLGGAVPLRLLSIDALEGGME